MENQNSAISGGDDSYSNVNCRVKLMCSYGGRIQPRPHDHQLTYVGGDTKILVVDRRVKFSDIVAKLITLCNATAEISFKYQLPGEDLDALVSVINDDDLEHMMAEYDRIQTGSSKPARIRLFLFAPNPPTLKNASTIVPLSSTQLNPDFLFGFDKEYEYDYQPESEIPRDPLKNVPDITGSDPYNRGQIRGFSFAGLHETYSRESHVTSVGGGPGPVVYRIPVAAGGYQSEAGIYGMPAVRVLPGLVYRDPPVYNFVPAMAKAPEMKLGLSADERRLINGVGLEEGGVRLVAADDGGRSEVYNGEGVLSPHPTATMAATLFGGAKNNII